MAVAPAPAGAASLDARIEHMIERSQFRGARTGLAVYDRTSGRFLAIHNGRGQLRPGSNMKLATSAALLARFGPSARLKTRIMASGRTSAAAERQAVQKAVVWFDRRMGPILGTNKRVARADFRAGDDKHNFDCWDTTRNTTSLLLVLQDWKLLKFHTVGNPHYRGNTLVLQTPHNTAVLVDRATRVEWVVDMWPRGYAQVPDVMTVERWVKED